VFLGTTRYEVLRRLGEGGMGVVYQARDRQRQATVALKTLRHVDATSIYRLKAEFRALADVNHPNLVTLHELQCVDGQWFFSMEFVDGLNFLSYVRHGYELSRADTLELAPAAPQESRSASLDVPRLRAALGQLAQGVTALHQVGKLHRDIKPANVLVTEGGRVVLLDFGLVTDSAPSRPRLSIDALVGTAAYMAPEQAASEKLTAASDWYAVGVMLYEALTGRLPFDGSSLEIMVKKQSDEPRPPAGTPAEAPPDLVALCMELLRRRPEDRPPAAEIQRRLGAASDERPPPTKRTSSSPARLIGRELQLGALANAFDASAERATVVFVHGSSGMGKSALVRRFLESVDERALILTGRCYERESVPSKGFDRLIDSLSTHLLTLPAMEVQAILPRDVAALLRVFPTLRRVAVLADARRIDTVTADAQELRRRAFAGLRELLARLADRRRLVLFVDDLQWGDVDSASLLAELLRPPDAPALLFIGSYRSEDAATTPVVRALPRDNVIELALDKLTIYQARELAASLLDGIAGADAGAIARESGGSPFFIGELVRYIEVGAGIGGGEVTLDRVVARRLEMLPERARRLLHVLALHGRPLPREVALLAAELPPDDGAVAQLRVNNLARTRGGEELVETYHDRIRETVMALVGEEAARRCHAKLAAALEAFGSADAESLADHHHGAGDLERAGHWFDVAAAQAVEMLAFDRAARLYRMALELLPAARGLRVKLGDALVNAGRGAEAARAYLSAREGASAVEQRILTRRAAEQFLFSGHIDEGRALMRQVLRALGMDLSPTQARSLASLVMGRARLRLRGFAFEERAASEIAPDILERIDACWSIAHGFGMVDVLTSHQFHTRHMLLALDAGEPNRIARALAIEPTIASAGGNFARAEKLIALATELAERTGNPHALGLTSMEAATVAFMQGNFKLARQQFERAEQIFRERCTGVSSELGTTQQLKLITLFYLGDLQALAQGVPDHIRHAEERGDLFSTLVAKISYSNVYWLISDDAAGARRQAEDAVARWSSDGFHVQHFAALTALAHVDLYLGDAEAAWRRVQEKWRAVKASILFRVQSSRTEAHLLRARAALAMARARPDGRERLVAIVEQHAKKLAATPIRHARPQALLLLAGAAATRGDDARARALLDEAIAACAAADLALHELAGRYRRGQLAGGDAGRAEAAAAVAALHGQKVRVPERMFALVTPGFAAT
jgi:eukaryotic-like serine/threonine-protein kinase